MREPNGTYLSPCFLAHALALGQRLPTLPLWPADDQAVPPELEGGDEETCRVLRIT